MTTATASLNTKIDPHEKELFVETAEELGMSPSSAIRIFVHSFIECGGFPFAVRKGFPISNQEQLEIEELDRAIDNGTAKTYENFQAVINEIDNELAHEG